MLVAIALFIYWNQKPVFCYWRFIVNRSRRILLRSKLKVF